MESSKNILFSANQEGKKIKIVDTLITFMNNHKFNSSLREQGKELLRHTHTSYLKLYKSKNYNELTINLKKSIKNIKKDHYKNYFIYAYNKDFYKER